MDFGTCEWCGKVLVIKDNKCSVCAVPATKRVLSTKEKETYDGRWQMESRVIGKNGSVYRISTVQTTRFGLPAAYVDHSFETLVFANGHPIEETGARYAEQNEAIKGHNMMIDVVLNIEREKWDDVCYERFM